MPIAEGWERWPGLCAAAAHLIIIVPGSDSLRRHGLHALSFDMAGLHSPNLDTLTRSQARAPGLILQVPALAGQCSESAGVRVRYSGHTATAGPHFHGDQIPT